MFYNFSIQLWYKASMKTMVGVNKICLKVNKHGIELQKYINIWIETQQTKIGKGKVYVAFRSVNLCYKVYLKVYLG